MSREGTRPGASATLAVAAAIAAALMALALAGGGFGARVNGGDLYAVFLSKYRYIAETYLAGRFPLWNPYEFCGLPLHGTAQGGALYLPISLANMVLRPLPALQALYGVHLLALVFLLLRYLRRAEVSLGAAAAGATLGAATVFNGLAFIGIDHPNYLFEIVWVPALLLAWEALRSGRRGAAAALALLAGIQWLPGYPEIPMATAALLVAFVALDGPPRTLVGRSVTVGLLVGLGVLLAAAQLLPLTESVGESVRVAGATHYATLRRGFAIQGPGHLVRALVGRYGAAGVFCLLLGLLAPRRQRLAWGLAFAWTVFATNRPFVWLYALWPFAGIRYAFGWNTLTPVFAALLAGAGVEWLRRTEGTRWGVAALAGVLALACLAAGVPEGAPLALACGVAAYGPLRRRGAWLVPVALMVVHAGTVMSRVGASGKERPPDLVALAPHAAALGELRARLPEHPRVASGKEIRAGLALVDRLPSPAGYEPAQPPRRMSRLGEALGLDTLALGWEVWMHLAPKLAAAPGAASALGLGVVVLPPGQAPALAAGGWREAARLPGGDVAFHRPAVPRFHLVHATRVAADEEESLRLVLDPGFDPARSVVLEDVAPPAVSAPTPGATENVRVVHETPEHLRLVVTADSPGVLVVADAHYPGWEATVDGTPAPILRANYALRGLALTPGTHTVEMVYRPRAFRLGVLVSLGGLVLVALLARWRGALAR